MATAGVAQPETAGVVQRARCPACGSGAFNLLLRESFDSPALLAYFAEQYQGRADIAPLVGHFYELVRCPGCSLAYQRAIPSERLLQEIYQNWIPSSERDRLQQQYTLEDFRYWAGQVQFLIRHLGKPAHRLRVLDFGMGWAEWALMARAYGCQVAGAELSPARIEHARAHGIPVVGWEEIATQRYDFINTEQVFEHLVEPLSALKHLARALDTGGLLKISVPDARRALRRVRQGARFESLRPTEIMPIAPVEHINCFEYRSLVKLAELAGLREVRPSLGLLYDSASGWLSPRRALRLLARPVYRHVYPKSTFLYFSKPLT